MQYYLHADFSVTATHAAGYSGRVRDSLALGAFRYG